MAFDPPQQTSAPPSRRLFFFTHPRCASNLTVRMLNLAEQPNVNSRPGGGGYHFRSFMQTYANPEIHQRPRSEWTSEELGEVQSSLQQEFNDLQGTVQAAGREGHILFDKEHTCLILDPAAWQRFVAGSSNLTTDERRPWTVKVPGWHERDPTHSLANCTPLPDRYMEMWLPTFLIRHPALAFPSFERASGGRPWPSAPTRANCTLAFSRALYEFYIQQYEHSVPQGVTEHERNCWPIILDADDIMSNPAVLERWCDLSGLDKTKLKLRWDPLTEDQLDALPRVAVKMSKTLNASAGVLADKMSNDVDIDSEAINWRREFGEVRGSEMEDWVRSAMADYEYMRARRLQV
jgi:hypothetical protein